MKKLICLLVALSALTVWGQDPEVNLKWGKPSEAEMTMTECTLDPDAEAVVLYNNEECALDMHAGQFKLTTTMKEGAYANKIAATAYNIVDGQTVATKMKDDLVFKEDINDYTRQYKFTIPQVSVGTVFEYHSPSRPPTTGTCPSGMPRPISPCSTPTTSSVAPSTSTSTWNRPA